jgi:hypothetical protein
MACYGDSFSLLLTTGTRRKTNACWECQGDTAQHCGIPLLYTYRQQPLLTRSHVTKKRTADVTELLKLCKYCATEGKVRCAGRTKLTQNAGAYRPTLGVREQISAALQCCRFPPHCTETAGT